MNVNDLLEQGAELAQAEAEATKERESVPASNNAEDTQTNEQTDVQAQEEKSLSKVERLLMQAMEEVEQANEDEQSADEPAQDVQDSEDIDEQSEEEEANDTATDEEQTDTDEDEQNEERAQALTDDMDEDEPTGQDVEEANESEDSDEITQLVQALEEERTKIEQERKEFQKKIDEMNKQLKKMEDEKQRAEQNAIKTAISYDLVNRDDVKDPRLLFQLIDTSDIDTSGNINEQVTNKINKLVQKYPSLTGTGKPKKYINRNKDGMNVVDEVRPIGKAMDGKPIPEKSKEAELKQLFKRAKAGSEKDKIEYIKKRREFGKVSNLNITHKERTI